LKGHSGKINAVAFSPDGSRLLSGSDDKTLKMWDAAGGSLLRTFEGHRGAVTAVAFSADGTRVVSGSSDRALKIWDAASGSLLHTLSGHAGVVGSVAFSHDGLRLGSGSLDGTNKLWGGVNGELRATLIANRAGQSLAITPSGFFWVARNGAEMLSVVRGVEVYSVQQFYEHLSRPDLLAEQLKGDPEGKYRDASSKLNLQTILDSGPAPQIDLKERKTESAGDTVRLAIRITDTGGGIGDRVIWRVNGKTQGELTIP